MEISNELKDNLITDVEHTIGLDLSSAQINALERAFEITIGHAISALSIPQPERTAEEFIKSKYPQDYDDIPKWHLEDMHEYAVQGIDWPSEEESNEILDKKAFRVPYDGSDNFYDESFIKGWKACYEWVLKRLKK